MGKSLKPGSFLIKFLWEPVLACAVLLALSVTISLLKIPANVADLLRHVLALCIIGAVSWLCIRLVNGLEEFVLKQYDIAAGDNLRARKIHTQLRVIKRIVIVIIIIIGFSAMLMTFEKVKQLGTSLLASAGIAGIIIGFSAQRSLATLFAGLQIAITQPIRIDDVVIVENEWGRVEEITLTYVVVRIWDLRRLVLPITYFTERPFQNWTRVSADILGTVFIYVDYTASVQAIRSKFFEILDQSKLWDRKVRSMQVTNTTDRTMEVRALMSAPDASTAWNLRCEVREKLIDFIQQRYPDSLPRIRGDILGNRPEG
jgi:small-conductance mechanosensitive channel